MSELSIVPKGRKSLPMQYLRFGRHLIYSEGTKTEPNYIGNIWKNIAAGYKQGRNEICIIGADDKKSYNTVNLVNFAFSDVGRRLKEGETINHVWIFFDKDDFNDFDRAHEQIERKNDSEIKNAEDFPYDKQTGISWHSCWSNECFELWLCLYFDYLHSNNIRKTYIDHLNNVKKLKSAGFEYKKNMNNIHDILESAGGSAEKAIMYAKKLYKANGIQSPSTGVYRFAEYFLPYMEKTTAGK